MRYREILLYSIMVIYNNEIQLAFSQTNYPLPSVPSPSEIPPVDTNTIPATSSTPTPPSPNGTPTTTQNTPNPSTSTPTSTPTPPYNPNTTPTSSTTNLNQTSLPISTSPNTFPNTNTTFCDYTCASCSPQAKISCLTCSNTDFRILQNNDSCPCDQGYFDTSVAKCSICDYSCATCNSSKDACLSCNQAYYREMNGSSCPCKKGYYDNNQAVCLATCDYSCTTCDQVLGLNCLSCSPTNFRTLNGSNCQCDSNYYDQQSSICTACDVTCATCNFNTVSSCLSCSEQNFRTLINSTCFCNIGYYDVQVSICSACESRCLTCQGQTNSDCLSCDIYLKRELFENQCICETGYQESEETCFYNPLSQQEKPSCNLQNCESCSNENCSECSSGYYLSGNICSKCDTRCKQCSGPQISQCQGCKFITIDQTCKLCPEVYGLQLKDGQCLSVCGDTIVYKLTEECDDGNLDNDDGCSSKCKITPILYQASLNFLTNQNEFNNLRIAYITFQEGSNVTNFTEWQFSVTKYDAGLYNLGYNYSQNQLVINLTFYQSVVDKQLTVIAPHSSNLTNNIINATIPRYTLVEQGVQESTQSSLDVNDIFIKIVFIIMGVSLITGGVDMISELLDLLQLLSYLKYFNVRYPFNLDAYFNSLSPFNFSFITNNIPAFSVLNSDLNQRYQNQGKIQTDKKFDMDQYNSLFTFNFGGVIFASGSLILGYYMTRIIDWIFQRWAHLDDLQNLMGIRQKFYLYRFKFSHFIVTVCNQLKINFFYSGLFRIFIASEYNMNFILMLEFKKHHFLDSDFILASSSWLALIVFFSKIIMQYFLVFRVIALNNIQLQQNLIKNEIGSVVEGYNGHYGAKYFGVIIMAKKYLFMFFLVIFYNEPLYQISGIMITSLIFTCSYWVVQPFEKKDDYLKSVSCELMLFTSTFLILLYAVDDYNEFLGELPRLQIGWIVISCCLLIIFIQLVIDTKKNFIFIHKWIHNIIKMIMRRRQKILDQQKIKQTKDQDLIMVKI